jgi:O-antigen ligase
MAALVFVVGAIAVAAVLGLAAGGLNTTGAAGLAVIGLAAIGALLFRRTMSAPAALGKPTGDSVAIPENVEVQPAGEAPGEDKLLRIPRLLFYAGALTLTQAHWRPAAGLTVSEIFFITAFFATVAAVLAGRPASKLPTALIIGIGIFTFGGLLSSIGAVNEPASVVQVMQGIYVMLLWAWTGATVLRTRRQIIVALTCWSISAAFDGFAAMLQVAHITGLGGPLEGNRATGLTDHPNDLGAACAIALVPALMLATTRLPGRGLARSDLARAIRWVVLALTAAGVVFSASVGAMFAALIAILIWMVAPAVRAPGRIAVIAALALGLIALTLAGSSITSPTKRIKEVTSSGPSQSTGSASVRIKTIKQAWPKIESNPIVGQGMDSSGSSVDVINQGVNVPYQVHGSPVSIWYQAGFFGLLGVTIVSFTLLIGGWQSLSGGDRTDMVIGISIVASFVAFFVYAMTAPFVLQQYGWFSGVMLLAWRMRRDAVAKLVVPLSAQTERPAMRPLVPSPQTG